jgi:hypothetical protein
MKRNLKLPFRSILVLILAGLVLSACGLFDDEREEENEPLISGVQFGEVVTAEGIGQNNAPVAVTDTFSDSQDYIYVVAEADHIEAGTTMFARWYRDGEPFEDSAEVTADRDYEDTYVEFHLENLQDNFEEGDYSVTIFVNGNPAEDVEFTVE